MTGLHQSVLDGLALPGLSSDDLVGVLVRACQPGRSTPELLRAELLRHARHPRRVQIDALLEAAELGLGSAAEWCYVRDVERAHGLPAMVPQAALSPSGDLMHGGRAPLRPGREYLDFLDIERDVAVEIDGELFHRDRRHLDRSRDRRNAGRGRITLRGGWEDVVLTPCRLAADIAVVLRDRGWAGMPQLCSGDCSIGRDDRLRPEAG